MLIRFGSHTGKAFIQVKVILGGMGGELETDLPFKLVHPKPDSIVSTFLIFTKKHNLVNKQQGITKFESQHIQRTTIERVVGN